ncbi:OmpA family protein [Ottowia sp. oral taxon 894]
MTAGVLASRAWQRGKADAAALGRPVLQARVDGAGAAPRPVEPQAEPAAAVVQETVVIGDGPAVQVQEGVVKFYFATGKADLAEGAKEALADIVRGVAAGQTAVVSGFHDATGNAAFNAELAKKRAEAVRAALLELGVGEDKVTLQKPEAAEANASGSDAAARRVEVRLQ